MIVTSTIRRILSKIAGVNKSRSKFIPHILTLFLALPTRINFSQLARYSNKYNADSFAHQFDQYFDAITFNHTLIQTHGSGHYLLAFDPTFLTKSGKQTAHQGKFWASKLQKHTYGLELGLLSVIDVEHRTALHWDAVFSPNEQECKDKQITLLEHYAEVIRWAHEQNPKLSDYLAVDAYFAKANFINRVVERTSLQVISRFRKDADLLYLHAHPIQERLGDYTPRKRGRPRKYAGKVNPMCPDPRFMKLVHYDAECLIYDGIVYCRFLKRAVRLALTIDRNSNGSLGEVKLYFSTDLSLPAWMIVKYYRLRYQQEYLIRDGKQYTGLSHCQSRSAMKMDSHVNFSLTALNVAKVEQGLSDIAPKGFSIHDFKIKEHNSLLIDRIFDNLPLDVKMYKNQESILKLHQFGVIHHK